MDTFVKLLVRQANRYITKQTGAQYLQEEHKNSSPGAIMKLYKTYLLKLFTYEISNAYTRWRNR